MAQGTPAIYTVQPRDSLFSIAQRFYGDGNKYHQIYDYCNRQVIGPDPNVIRPGEVLYISAIAPVVKTCTVTSSTGLRHRAAPTSQSAEARAISESWFSDRFGDAGCAFENASGFVKHFLGP
ncbi:MAG TPA: LysM peptidoglycan-binding domain-containing protein [Ktedonobacteraceae bacterium]|nr:LysM peptidoglycan-binding domain-containing protein [Ktedonobacteraceae bacterium]